MQSAKKPFKMPTIGDSTAYSLPLLLLQAGTMCLMLLSLTLFALTLVLEMRYSLARPKTSQYSQSGFIGGGHGYSVYARGLERLGEALERLERYRPARKPRAALAADYHPVAQGYSNLDLPYHPAFSPEQLRKQRESAYARAREWNAMVDSISREFYAVASS